MLSCSDSALLNLIDSWSILLEHLSLFVSLAFLLELRKQHEKCKRDKTRMENLVLLTLFLKGSLIRNFFSYKIYFSITELT